MDLLLETQPKLGKSGECDHKNKWRCYRKGLHTPSLELVNAIETTHAGGCAVLNHVLWKTLRCDRRISSHAELWLSELHPEIQKIVYQREPGLGFGKTIRQSLNLTQLNMLERRAGLDALACLVILLRQATERHNGFLAQRLSRRMCRMLLVLGPTLSALGIGSTLIQYFEQELLPLATVDGSHYQFKDGSYQSASRRLTFLANFIEAEENCTFAATERIKLRIEILDGKRGDILDNLIVIAPPIQT